MENQPVNPVVTGHGGQFEMVEPGTGNPVDIGGQPAVIAEPAKPLETPQPAVPTLPVQPVRFLQTPAPLRAV